MAGILTGLYSGAEVARTERLPGRLRLGVARLMSLIVLSPSLFILSVFVYGFAIWSFVISMTSSKLAPKYDFVGLDQYFALWSMDRWHVAVNNLAIFAGLFVSLSIGLGLALAIFLDQRIRAENVIRSIYLYPMAISFIVTGTAWKWILNPGLGIEKLVRDLGWTSFSFDWVVNPNMSVYTLVIAAVWQSSGFAMAIFLAGLRGVDQEIIKAARIDGAGPWLMYRAVVIPILRPVFLTVLGSLDLSGGSVVRPCRVADRRRPRLLVRSAGDIHVPVRLRPKPHGTRCSERDDDLHDHRGRHGPLHLLGTSSGGPQ